jgi:hypothetical protein
VMVLPDRLYVREQRDQDFDCLDFTTRPLLFGERAECDTDGHYRCRECRRRNPNNYIDAEFEEANAARLVQVSAADVLGASRV